MDNETLRCVQLCQLDIAKEFKRICEEHNIDYFLDSGSLLGAVRHGGFIPWDDDMDFGLRRDQYEKFLNIAPNVINSNYYLQTWDSDPNYNRAFSKIRKKGTLFLEETVSDSKAGNEIYIDIFPYDVFPNEKKLQIKQGLEIETLKKMLLLKEHYRPWVAHKTIGSKVKCWVKYIPIRFLNLFFKNRDSIKEYYYSVMTKYNMLDTGLSYEQTGGTRYGKWVIPSSCLDDLIDLKFEDTTFKCSKNYHEYLTTIYGDYMKLPPVDERENIHMISKVIVE